MTGAYEFQDDNFTVNDDGDGSGGGGDNSNYYYITHPTKMQAYFIFIFF